MLIRDKKFDEFTLPDKITKINMTHALVRLSASVSKQINVHLSTYGGRSNMSVHPQTTQCIPYELLLHALNSIDVCAIERPPYTTGVLEFRVHKGSKIIYLRQVQFNLHLIEFILKNCFQKDTRAIFVDF
jgi:hypothetical protein